MRDDIHRLLSDYTTTDPLEGAFLTRMHALAGVAGDPTRRDHFEPGHFTASAFVLSPDRSALLLIHHKKLGRWLQPGGHLDPDDTSVRQATLREVEEETGVTALAPLGSGLFDVDVHDIPAHGSEPAHAHFDLRMAFVAESRHVVLTDEVAGVRWVPLAEVNAVESDASVMRAVARLRAALARG